MDDSVDACSRQSRGPRSASAAQVEGGVGGGSLRIVYFTSPDEWRIVLWGIHVPTGGLVGLALQVHGVGVQLLEIEIP